MKITSCLITILSLTVGTFAADKKPTVPDAKLADYRLGELITGPAADLANTGGKGVLIEAWGVHCPPCIASLPHMEQLAKAKKNRLIVIGAHSQSATNDQVKEVVKKNRLSYSIVNGVSGPGGTGTIPHAYVFDATGKLIFTGSPFDSNFNSSVQKASRPAPGASSSPTTPSAFTTTPKK